VVANSKTKSNPPQNQFEKSKQRKTHRKIKPKQIKTRGSHTAQSKGLNSKKDFMVCKPNRVRVLTPTRECFIFSSTALQASQREEISKQAGSTKNLPVLFVVCYPTQTHPKECFLIVLIKRKRIIIIKRYEFIRFARKFVHGNIPRNIEILRQFYPSQKHLPSGRIFPLHIFVLFAQKILRRFLLDC